MNNKAKINFCNMNLSIWNSKDPNMVEVLDYFDSSVNNDFETLVEETIVCSSSSYEDDHDHRDKKNNRNKLSIL